MDSCGFVVILNMREENRKRSAFVELDREVLLAELEGVFDGRTSRVVLGVLDRIIEQIPPAEVTRDEGRTELNQAIATLAEAQARAEDRLTRVEAAVERLAEAQARAEDRLTRVWRRRWSVWRRL